MHSRNREETISKTTPQSKQRQRTPNITTANTKRARRRKRKAACWRVERISRLRRRRSWRSARCCSSSRRCACQSRWEQTPLCQPQSSRWHCCPQYQASRQGQGLQSVTSWHQSHRRCTAGMSLAGLACWQKKLQTAYSNTARCLGRKANKL